MKADENKIRRMTHALEKMCSERFGVRPWTSMRDEAKVLSYIAKGYSLKEAEKKVYKE